MKNINQKENRQVLFLPDYTKGNPYQSLLKSAIESRGFNVLISDFAPGLFAISRAIYKNPSVDIVHIHWIPTLISPLQWTKGWKRKLKLALLWCDIYWARYIQNKRIVWTIHNKFAHQNFEKSLEISVRALLFRSVDARIFHSTKAETIVREALGINKQLPSKVIYHGNYDGCYPLPNIEKNRLKTNLLIPSNHLTVLTFGMLRPYKGVDKLIQNMQANQHQKVTLIVAGQAQDPDYEKIITGLAKDLVNVKLQLRFLSDQELSNYLYMVDIVAVPFEDTLTSGSVLLSMTYGKALLVSDKARNLGVIPEKGALFYKDQAMLENHLKNLPKYDLSKMGQINRQRAEKYSWETVGKETTQVYKFL